MASWADKPVTFNPYVQQLPTEAYVSVGVEKQRRYDEGIRKIQSQIDNVAGLDVIRDVDKQYLRSKLDTLGTNLRSVAAGDFSNYQLVNSVGGMVNQIAKDPNVQNAVSSASWYRKQVGLIQKDIEEGKQNPANIDDFETKANVWINSTKPGEKFTGSYQTPIDYMKKWTDALGKLHTNLTSQDILNVMDSKGNIDPNKLAATMVRTKTEGVSIGQIENAIRSTMGPEDLNQLAIEGRYRFKGVSPETLQGHARMEYQSDISKIDKLIQELDGHAKLNASDVSEYNRTTEAINELKAKRKLMEDTFPTLLRDIATNPEEAKFQMYKDGAIRQFATAFSWEHKILEHHSNPALEAQDRAKGLALQAERLELDKDKFIWSKRIDEETLKLRLAELNLKLPQGSGYTIYKGESTVVKDPVIALRSDTNAKRIAAEKIISDYAASQGTTTAAVRDAIEKYKNNNPKAIKGPWREKIDEAIRMMEDADANETAIKVTREEILSDPSMKAKQLQIDSRIRENDSFVLNTGNRIYTFSNDDIYRFLAKKNRAVSLEQTAQLLSPWGNTKFVGVTDSSQFDEKELALYNYIYASNTIDPDRRRIAGILQQYDEPLRETSALNREIENKVTDKLMTKVGRYIPQVATLGTPNEAARSDMEDLASLALSLYTDPNGTQGGREGLPLSRIKEIQETWLKGKNAPDIKYRKLVQGDNSWLVMSLGKEEVEIPITQGLSDRIRASVDEPSYFQRRLQDRYAKYGGKTNITSDPGKAYFKASDFPNVKNYMVAADLEQNQSNPAWNHVMIHIYSPSAGWKSISMDDYRMDLQNVQRTLQSLTDEKIKELATKYNIPL